MSLRLRYPLLLVALVTLLLAAWAGLLRIGWSLPLRGGTLAAAHGPLMVSGFLGTLIALERAVALAALGRRWVYVAPVLSALGAVTSLLGLAVGPWLLAAGSLALVAVFSEILRRQPASQNYIMAGGAAMWAAGNLLWIAGRPLFEVTWWWGGYLVLTVAAERLELARYTNFPRRAMFVFFGLVALFVVGVAIASFSPWPGPGVRWIGASLLLLTLWLLRFDIARRTVRRSGATRFIAANLLLGYAWLGISGLLALVTGHQVAGPLYDATLHALFLGFVFGMIFGHALVIFPSILGRAITYTPRFYVHVILLQASLVLRVGADLAGWMELRRWGGMLNGIALLLFLLNTALALRGRPYSQNQKNGAFT